MKRTLPLFLLAALCSPSLAAPIPIGPGSLVYSQNFDALASATNNNPATTTWADDSTILGWWEYRAGNAATPTGLAGAADTYYVADGNAAPNTVPLAHGFYSLGVQDATDRAMGLCPTTAQGELSAIVIFQNTSAAPLTLSRVKYTAEAYRSNTTAAVRDSIFVWWKTAASSAALLTNTTATTASNTTDFIVGTNTTGPTSYYITGWTNLPEFTYTHTTPTPAVALPPDTQAFDSAPTSSTVVVPAGQFLALRWSNINDGGTDAIQGFDDLVLTFSASTGCTVDATITGVTRLPGANAASATDDSVQFTVNATATGGSAGGWKVPAGGLGGGTTGAYGVPVVITAPIAGFGVTGTASVRVEDSGDSTCFKVVSVSAPPFIQKVTSTNSPTITFTPAAVGSASFLPPAADQSELGWTGGAAGATTNSNVQLQPSEGAFVGTMKYWALTTAPTTFTTDPVDVSGIAGQNLEGRIELALYTTSGTGLEPADVLNAHMEVALDGDFANVAAGNILTAVFVDETGTATDVFGDTIAAAATYKGLAAGTYPTVDFIFHPFVKTLGIPAGATAARARILFSSSAGITTTEHVLLDNVRFSLSTAAGDTDGDGMPDDYEIANGLNPNSNADRNTDLDGDGQSNYMEYVAGTQANNAASTLRVTSAALSATNEVSLTWASVAGKRYQAQISTDLGNAVPWASLGAAITATGPSTSVPPGIIIPAGNLRYFLRISVVP